MENKVIEVLDALCDKFGMAIDWTQQNVMPQMIDIFERIRTYYIAIDALSIFVGIVILVLASLTVKRIFVGKRLAMESYANWPFTMSEPYDVSWREYDSDKNKWVTTTEKRTKKIKDKDYKPIESIYWDNDYDDMRLSAFGIVVSVLVAAATIIAIACICNYTEDLLKWIITPELNFINLVKDLM